MVAISYGHNVLIFAKPSRWGLECSQCQAYLLNKEMLKHNWEWHVWSAHIYTYAFYVLLRRSGHRADYRQPVGHGLARKSASPCSAFLSHRLGSGLFSFVPFGALYQRQLPCSLLFSKLYKISHCQQLCLRELFPCSELETVTSPIYQSHGNKPRADRTGSRVGVLKMTLW